MGYLWMNDGELGNNRPEKPQEAVNRSGVRVGLLIGLGFSLCFWGVVVWLIWG